MIVKLDPATIAPSPNQHRQKYHGILKLCKSIKAQGQLQDVKGYYIEPKTAVYKNVPQVILDPLRTNGKTHDITVENATIELIYGHTRCIACLILGIDVSIEIIDKPDDIELSMLTLSENTGSTAVNPIEEAVGYKTSYDLMIDAGYTHQRAITTLSKSTGNYERYIQDRLKLIELTQSAKALLSIGARHEGGMNLSHALAIAEVSREYQQLFCNWYAKRAIENTPEGIEQQIANVKQLYYDSLQRPLISMSTEPDTAKINPLFEMEEKKPTRNGSSRTPQTIDPLILAKTVKQWKQDIEQWKRLGRHTTADLMSAKVESMESTIIGVIASPYAPFSRILVMLSEAETTTTGKLQRHLHLSPDHIYDYLELLLSLGYIESMKSGRGTRHRITANGLELIE